MYDGQDGLVAIATSLGLRSFAQLAFSSLFSIDHYYVLGLHLRNLQETLPATKRRQQPSPITEHDLVCIRNELRRLPTEDRREILSRLRFYGKGFTNCYVIRNGDDIAYMQWIIFPTENQVLAEHVADRFYPLAADQIMIENAFTFPRYRGRGYFLEGTRHLLAMARERGYRNAICYIRKDRIASLNQMTRMGFRIVKLVGEYKFLGKAWRAL